MIDKPEDKTKRELVEIVKIQQEEYKILLVENAQLKFQANNLRENLRDANKRTEMLKLEVVKAVELST